MYWGREQWEKWAKSLNPGDKVIVRKWGTDYKVRAVDHVTKSGLVVLDTGACYSFYARSGLMYRERGGFSELLPFTEELENKAKEQAEERERQEQTHKTILDAKLICRELCYEENGRVMTLELARKIIELVGAEK